MLNLLGVAVAGVVVMGVHQPQPRFLGPPKPLAEAVPNWGKYQEYLKNRMPFKRKLLADLEAGRKKLEARKDKERLAEAIQKIKEFEEILKREIKNLEQQEQRRKGRLNPL